MTLLGSVLAGIGFGFGVLLVLRALFQSRAMPLDDLAAKLSRVGTSASDIGDPSSVAKTSLFGQAADRLAGAAAGDASGLLDQRLRLVGKTRSQLAGERLLIMMAGFALPVIVAAILFVAGFGVSPLFVLLASVGLGVAGFLYPGLPLAEQAEVKRREFRFALGAYLDFVTVMLAGGAGTQSALQAAAEAGGGPTFEALRQAIRRADTTGRSTWEVFGELADDYGISELQELSASVALASGQGARVRDSLSAKADALRVAQAAELEAIAESQTEKMILPVVVMIGGLVLFVGYGAVSAVSGVS